MFSDGASTPAWWERWLRPGYQHVDLMVFDGGHATLIESYNGRVSLTTYESHVAHRLIERWPFAVVHYRLKQWRRSIWPLGMTTCVSLAKAVLGCNDWRVQTPYKLHEWAKREGGYVIVSESA